MDRTFRGFTVSDPFSESFSQPFKKNTKWLLLRILQQFRTSLWFIIFVV